MERKLICIICPRGCALTVKEENFQLSVDGYGCTRGKEYAINECTNPVRTVTSTVRVAEGISEITLLPVKSAGPVPKRILFDLAALCRDVVVETRCKRGDVIVPNALGSGVDLVAGTSL